MIAKLDRYWLVGLVMILGLYYVMLGINLGGAAGLIGIAGGLLIVLAVPLRNKSRRFAAALLLVGSVPLAVTLWWSVVVPALAVATLVLGGLLMFRSSSKGPVPVP